MLRHQGTKFIETERLILRRAEASDAQYMFDNWASDPMVTRYLTWPAHSSVEISQMVIDSWITEYASDSYYHWMIVLKELGQPIGTIGMGRISEDFAKAEAGYCLGRSWWHQGIMTEALQATMDYLVDEVGFRRIEARHDARNPHSGAVMRKCGMVYEGTYREMVRNDKDLCDVCHYAMTLANE